MLTHEYGLGGAHLESDRICGRSEDDASSAELHDLQDSDGHGKSMAAVLRFEK